MKSYFNSSLLSVAISVHLISAYAANAASPQSFRLERETVGLAREKIEAVLQKFCGDACELVNVEAAVDESTTESDELGFESVANDTGVKSKVSGVVIDIQVDDRVTSADQARLGQLITNSVRSLTPGANVRWSSVAFPQIGVSAEVEDRLKQTLHQRIQSAVQQTIDSYCPKECLLSNVNIDGRLVSADQARGVPERELVRERGGRGILRIENVDIDVSIDDKLPEATRTKIYNIIKAKTRFALPVNVNMVAVEFPEAPAAKEPQDPWGLDRLRQTLQIFRDLAGTKEIITNSTQTSSTSSKEQSERSESKESRDSMNMTSKEKSTASEKEVNSKSEKSAEISASEKKTQGSENTEYMMYIAGFLVLAGILVAMIMRFASSSKDARIMIDSTPGSVMRQNSAASGNNQGEFNSSGGSGYGAVYGGQVNGMGANRESFSLKMKIEGLREELLQTFMDNPKVARDTFSRMLQEEGVEQTSRYVYIFGPMIIFDLMNDPNLKRELHDLGEYYYKATFSFTDEQTLEALSALKTKVTASEIRVMAHKRAEQFSFLQNLDSSQIFTLVSDEKPHVQSVVLTQLDPARRRVVFDLYEGEAKVNLMRELCRADAIPKEYLSNVAKALHKKVLGRTDFDTEQLRSSDIILDLLEKASLQNQRELMADLVKTNPEAARAIKLKLITVEMLPYIKDGHLLEIVMGLEREDLLAFLVGAPDYIRELLLAKAPSELAQSWMEDIEQLSGIEEARYRLSEMRILGRVRNLANSGAIRLVDINERIFAEEHLEQVRRDGQQVEMALGKNFLAA